jgi:hypothetical protein
LAEQSPEYQRFSSGRTRSAASLSKVDITNHHLSAQHQHQLTTTRAD